MYLQHLKYFLPRNLHIVFLIAGFALILFLTAPLEYKVQAARDSASYLTPAVQLLQGEAPDFSRRTPAYPVVLWAGMILENYFDPGVFIWLFQVGIQFLAFMLYYRLIRSWITSDPWPGVFIAFFTWISVMAAEWSSWIMTESLGISYLIIWLWLHLRLTKEDVKFPFGWTMLAIFLDVLVMFQRQIFFLLPLLVLSLEFFSRRKSVLRFSIVALLALAWPYWVQQSTGHYEISYFDRQNQIDRAISFGGITSDYCEHHSCAEVTKDLLAKVFAEGPPAKSGSGGRGFLVDLLMAHPYLTRDRMVDQINSDLAPLRPQVLWFSVKLFFSNFARQGKPSFPYISHLEGIEIPQVSVLENIWYQINLWWYNFLSLGCLALPLYWRRIRNNRLLSLFVMVSIYVAATTVKTPDLNSVFRYMASAVVPINLIGLLGWLEIFRRFAKIPKPLIRNAAIEQ